MAAAPAAADDGRFGLLREQLSEAISAVTDAYRHNARLIRVLSVLGQPSAPEELVEQTLTVLSNVFSADITLTARREGDHLTVTSCCGLPEDDPALRTGWPVDRCTAEAADLGRPVARGPQDIAADELPPAVSKLNIRSGAWVPLSDEQTGMQELLILYRRSGAIFTPVDLQLLASVAARLSLAVGSRNRTAAVERLAQSSHRLTRHLDQPEIFQEAVSLLPELLGADGAWLVTVGEDGPQVRARSAGIEATATELTDTTPSRTVLCVPIRRDEGPSTFLYAVRDRGRAFHPGARETAGIFANYLDAALTNAALYRKLRESEASLRLITDSISDLISVVDANGRFSYVSPSHQRELGHNTDLLIGSLANDLVHPADLQLVQEAMLNTDRSTKVEFRFRAGDGDWVWLESALRPAPWANKTMVVSSRVVSDRKRLEDELREQATHDPLTGLANRVLTAARLDDLLGGAESARVGLLFCDLDKFKAVNDRLGHEAGDELLQQVARRLYDCLRSVDLLGRFGGDEFVIVLADVKDLDDVRRTGDRVSRSMVEPFTLRGERVEMALSVGGVIGIPGRVTSGEMLRDADAAMYAAKNQGSGLVAVFDEAASTRALDHLGIQSELLRVLDRQQLSVQYQPVVDLRSRRIVAFEALLRWNHPLRGSISPEVFIPLAEENGAINAIGDWVLAEACQQLAAWRRLPGRDHLEMNVNLSPVQLAQPDLATRMLHLIKQTGLPSDAIWLEITEHSSISSDVTEFATALHEAGVHFTLDDFGVSHSNLVNLERFPVEGLKIDRSFVSGLTVADTDRGVVRAVLAIADSLHLRVVAEGIETSEQCQALSSLGCYLGQGFLFSRPLPSAEATALLRSGGPLPFLSVAATARPR